MSVICEFGVKKSGTLITHVMPWQGQSGKSYRLVAPLSVPDPNGDNCGLYSSMVRDSQQMTVNYVALTTPIELVLELTLKENMLLTRELISGSGEEVALYEFSTSASRYGFDHWDNQSKYRARKVFP